MMKATILVLCAFVAVGFAESSLGLDEDSSRPILDVDDPSAPIQYRVQRSPEPQGSLSATYVKPLDGPERRPTYNFDYNHRLVNRKDGNIDLSVGGQKLPGRRVEPTVGLSGTFRFRRSPEPQGSLSGTFSKPFGGPERRPTYNFDYNHRLVNRKDGNVDLSVGGQKLPGRRVEPTVGLSSTFRFRRSPEPQGSLSGTFSKPFGGPERRPTYNFDYNHRLVNRKDGNVDLSVGGQKLPGRRVEPTVGLSGTFRFRRSPEPQGSLSATYVKPLDGPERRPTYNFDYNNRLVNRKDGNIDLSVGAQKLPGSRVEPTVGLSGTFRFRRSSDSEN
ncbi:uncharacterized protein LOC107267894 [Cephus cinctus]|uniref:Uncharacterized protein LOC107267894 n=1 Tax=Cephus cinctus TaxID=211228 RepID=A0AAJ7FJY4_CEPCN|nr:uncharacterized protein LOC107267894 [Cephus cinctus]